MPRHRPRISVIMAVYNCEDYVADAITSVQEQTIDDWELLCVDDASADDSAAVVERLAAVDPRIILIRQPENRGPASARNTALARARGEFVAVLDSDDMAPPRRFESSLNAFAQTDGLGLVGGQYHIIGPSGEVHERVERPALDDAQFKAQLSRHLMPVPHSSCMIRRELLAGVGGYDERLPAAQDFDMVLRVSPQCRCARLDECLLYYRHRPGQITENNTFAQALYSDFAFRRQRARNEGAEFNEDAELERIKRRVSGRHGFSRAASNRLRAVALRAVQAGDHRRFRLLIGRAVAYWPFSPHTLFWGLTSFMPAPVSAGCVALMSRVRRALNDDFA